MFNNIISFTQKKLDFLYKKSIILQNLDNVILPLILAVYFFSMFLGSDYIGFLALIIIFLTIIKICITPNDKISLSKSEIILLIYFFIVVVSLFGSTLFSLSLKGFLKTLTYLGFYFSLSHYFKNNLSKVNVILGTIALCIGLEGILGVFQSTLHLEQISTWQDVSNINPEDVISRVYGSLKPLNPNLYGGYLVSGLGILIGSIFHCFYNRHFKAGILFGLLSLSTIYAILQTGCRGAYLAMLLLFFATFILSAKFFWNKYKKIYTAIISSLSLLFLFFITFVNSLRLRFLSIFAMRSDSSNSFRFNVYNSCVEMFKDNWLLGIGIGNKNFREIYGLYMRTGFDALSAYNIYLETAVESGIFALVAFLSYLIKISFDAVKYIFNSENINNIIIISACIISVWALMFHGLVDTVFFRPQIQFIFWTLASVITIFCTNSDK